MVFLCLACFHKGNTFIEAAHSIGVEVYLVTSKKLETAGWPWECIMDVFYMAEDDEGQWNMSDLITGTAYFMREKNLDAIIALDDFDVERAAALREHFRLDGMGQTTVRFFRDKLAMRAKAASAQIRGPAFSSLFNNQKINQFLDQHPGPWIIKPRSEASAAGLKKVNTLEEAWNHINFLGDKRHQYLIECFIEGDVYHVDALFDHKNILFVQCSKYLNPPFQVAHGGGIFESMTLDEQDPDHKKLQELTQNLMWAFGMNYSATHSEFLKSKKDGKFYFVETSSRVGGAHLSEMVEFATGINLWTEWAKLEAAKVKGENYQVPDRLYQAAGIIISLSKYQHPDYSRFTDPAVVWRMNKEHHIGLIVKHSSQERVKELLDDYAHVIKEHYHASLPATDKPTH